MRLNDAEIARVQSVAPFLQSEAHIASAFEANYDVTMELEAHRQPGLLNQASDLLAASADADGPPSPLDLIVGILLVSFAFYRTQTARRAEQHWRALTQRFRRAFCAHCTRSISMRACKASQERC